jgi:polyferredoxin
VAHLIGIGIVVLQAWLGLICPLTIWEMNLRAKAGEVVYEGSFITHVLNDLLYYDAPAWVFVTCYTAFGGLVLLSWLWVPPRPFRARTTLD